MYICLTVKQFNFYQFFNSFELFKVFNFGFKIISIGSQCTVQNILKVGTLVLFFRPPSFGQWPLFFVGHGPYGPIKFHSRMNPVKALSLVVSDKKIFPYFAYISLC